MELMCIYTPLLHSISSFSPCWETIIYRRLGGVGPLLSQTQPSRAVLGWPDYLSTIAARTVLEKVNVVVKVGPIV